MGSGVVTVGSVAEWATDPFDCFEDMETLLLGMVCCWCQDRRTSAWLDNRPASFIDYGIGVLWCAFDAFTSCFCCCCHLLSAGIQRKKIKDRYMIGYNGNTSLGIGDCAFILCCYPCANCQHARELIVRGDDVLPANVVDPNNPRSQASYPATNAQPVQAQPVRAQPVQAQYAE